MLLVGGGFSETRVLIHNFETRFITVYPAASATKQACSSSLFCWCPKTRTIGLSVPRRSVDHHGSSFTHHRPVR
eukprot:204100-Prorocentrum_lima.AAC.1